MDDAMYHEYRDRIQAARSKEAVEKLRRDLMGNTRADDPDVPALSEQLYMVAAQRGILPGPDA